jgi:hydroxypyruvate reductase
MARKFISSKLCVQYAMVNDIIETALEAVDPYRCTQKFINLTDSYLKIGNETYIMNEIGDIYVLGTGKAVLPMTQAVCNVLGDHLAGGVIIGKHADSQILDKLPHSIQVHFGDHPVPSERSFESAQKMTAFTDRMKAKDLVICLISGGGSSLMTLPVETVSLADMQEVTRQLLFSGATINEVNAVRKHLDKIKGGGLAKYVWPAKLTTLVLSDVIGDSLDAIASGPTVPDASTYSDVLLIIHKYQLESSIPENVLLYIKAGKNGQIPETVKSDDECMQAAHTYIVGSLTLSIQAAAKKAAQTGFNTRILTSELTGEAREVGEKLAGELLLMAGELNSDGKPGLLIAGGETTVTVKGEGKGGRNQEASLSAAKELKGCPNCLFISLATDGEDGPTDAAGAAVNGFTITKGIEQGLDADEYLERNDAYHYLEAVDSLIKIGPTGTNVNDLVFAFAF